MAGLADQHGNLDVLRGLKQGFDEAHRTALRSRSSLPIALQVQEHSSVEEWVDDYASMKIPNMKADQIVALQNLERWEQNQRDKLQESLEIIVELQSLPPSKMLQYQERLRNPHNGNDPKWHECFVRLYTSAEWALEHWAQAAGLECIDLNAKDLFDKHDYQVNGRNIDVKTTISVGRSELKSYWSSRESCDTGEIICAIASNIKSLNERSSRHLIQGIFHAVSYETVSVPLQFFTLDRPLRNACYFHPLDIFFLQRKSPCPSVRTIDDDVIDFCVRNGQHLPAIFRISARDDALKLLRIALPSLHHDFAPVAAELMTRDMCHLLPHYLADYILKKIVSKEAVDGDVLAKVLWSVFLPTRDQIRYLEVLMRASKILPRLRCAHHGSENIEGMDIDVQWGKGKLILRARCGANPRLATTFLAYSWKTLETLVYGDPGISICDAPDCGCLTHEHDGRRIGRRSCAKYGDRVPI